MFEAIVIVCDRMYEKRTERIAGMGRAFASATKCNRGSVCHGGGVVGRAVVDLGC